MSQSIDCGVCFEAFDESVNTPRVASCGHTFCSACVTSIARAAEAEDNNGACHCPLCRASWTATDDFSVNYALLDAISVLKEAKSAFTSASFSAASSSAQNSEDDLLSAIGSGDADTASLIARSLARTRAEELRRDEEDKHAAASQDNPPDSPTMSAEEEARMLEDKERREKQLEEVLDQVKAARDLVEENLQSALLVQMRKDLLGGDGDEDVPREVVERAQKQPEVWRRRVLLQLDRLEKATLQLDEVSLGQHEDLRARRRTAVKTVQQLQGRIDMLNELVLSHEQFLIVIGSRTGAFLRQ